MSGVVNMNSRHVFMSTLKEFERTLHIGNPISKGRNLSEIKKDIFGLIESREGICFMSMAFGKRQR